MGALFGSLGIVGACVARVLVQYCEASIITLAASDISLVHSLNPERYGHMLLLSETKIFKNWFRQTPYDLYFTSFRCTCMNSFL